MLDRPLVPFLPRKINTGPWLAGYSLSALQQWPGDMRIVLPICSLGTPPDELAGLAPLVLPPLYHEALDAELKAALLKRIHECFPYFVGARARAAFKGTFEIVELPPRPHSPPAKSPPVFAFSIDTAVEQHGPHLPLATDTLESYAVLDRLAAEYDGVVLGAPIDYGHLTWGLPFGMSIDLTPALTTRYVRGIADAIMSWATPAALYVVDVHGSLVHRNAIEEGLRQSRCPHWVFRWLFEPVMGFAGDRGDQHAGGVETALVDRISRDLLDPAWWPHRVDDIAAHQMTVARAVELSGDVPRFVAEAETQGWNGIVGDIRNYFDLDPQALFDRMLAAGREDIRGLLGGG